MNFDREFAKLQLADPSTTLDVMRPYWQKVGGKKMELSDRQRLQWFVLMLPPQPRYIMLHLMPLEVKLFEMILKSIPGNIELQRIILELMRARDKKFFDTMRKNLPKHLLGGYNKKVLSPGEKWTRWTPKDLPYDILVQLQRNTPSPPEPVPLRKKSPSPVSPPPQRKMPKRNKSPSPVSPPPQRKMPKRNKSPSPVSPPPQRKMPKRNKSPSPVSPPPQWKMPKRNKSPSPSRKTNATKNNNVPEWENNAVYLARGGNPDLSFDMDEFLGDENVETMPENIKSYLRRVRVCLNHVSFIKAVSKTSRKTLTAHCLRADPETGKSHVVENYVLDYLMNSEFTQHKYFVKGQRYYWYDKQMNGFAIGIPLNPSYEYGIQNAQEIIDRAPGIQPTTLYIPIICASGAGKAIMHSIFAFAKQMGFKRIWLSAVAIPKVINFYKSLGFQFGPLCPHETEDTLKQFSLVEKVNTMHAPVSTKIRKALGLSERQAYYKVLRLGGDLTNNKTKEKMHWNGGIDGFLMTKCL